MSHLAWKTLSSEYLFTETWFTVRRDRCERPDGKIVDPYYVFEFPEWATALAITEDGKIILERQYRQALGEDCIELPGGCIDATDADAEAAIRRELREETGYVFDKVEYLGKVSANPSTNTNLMHMFIATGGKHVSAQQFDDNEDIEIFTATFEELMQMVDENKIMQSMHLSTILYAMKHLGKLQVKL